MDFKVSEISLNDRSQWESIYSQYAVFYEVPMTPEILDTVWSWIIDPQNKFYALVAKNNKGDILGLMHCREMASPLRGTTVGFLDDLFVLSNVRGTGVVDTLFEFLNNFAASKGWPLVRWLTANDNYRARGVYDKLASRTQWLTYQMPVQV